MHGSTYLPESLLDHFSTQMYYKLASVTRRRTDLNAAQIVEQVIMARRLLAADSALLPPDEAPTLTNVVSAAAAARCAPPQPCTPGEHVIGLSGEAFM